MHWRSGHLKIMHRSAGVRQMYPAEKEDTFLENKGLTAAEALEKLKQGNKCYLTATANPGDISAELRKATCEGGQSPYAVVVTCSDSRVVPESIFCAGLGELFVIRVAGNVMANHQIGSVEYGAEHLGCRLVVVLGHDNCGAVGAAMQDEPTGFIKTITDEIREAIGGEKDYYRACCLNVEKGVSILKESLHVNEGDDLKIIGAMYHIADGSVDFME